VRDAAPLTTGGSGSSWHGTLDQWLVSFPEARVLQIGYSLGSGILGDVTIHSITAGCLEYGFTTAEPAEPTSTEYVYGDDIRPDESTYPGWHEGYANAEVSYAVDEDGLHLGDPAHSQIIDGLDAPLTTTELEALITSAGVTVTEGSVTFQVPVLYGTGGVDDAPSFTTLRSLSLGAGEHGFSIADRWVSSRALVDNDGATVFAANTALHLADLVAFLNAQGDVQLLAYGVQADTAATVTSIVWDGTEYLFTGEIVSDVPVIEGTPAVAETLTVDVGDWTPSDLEFSYVWTANGTPIPGATESTYRLKGTELGDTIAVRVTGSAEGYTSVEAISFGVGPVTPAAPSTERLSGPDRFATAVMISEENYAPGVGRVYLANGLGYADALSAGPVAAKDGAPLLLTAPGSLPEVVAAELARLHPAEVILVGGEPSISAAVGAAVAELGFAPTVTRIAGSNRYETSRLLALFAFGVDGADTAYLSTGGNYPDALSAAPAAAHFGGPVVLVDGSSPVLDAATLGLLVHLGVQDLKIAGSDATVSAGIETYAVAVFGADHVTRNAGPDRFATSVAINADEFTTADTVYLATGFGYADALAGSALAGRDGAPLFASRAECVPAATMSAIQSLGATQVVLLGGPEVLSANVASLTVCS